MWTTEGKMKAIRKLASLKWVSSQLITMNGNLGANGTFYSPFSSVGAIAAVGPVETQKPNGLLMYD